MFYCMQVCIHYKRENLYSLSSTSFPFIYYNTHLFEFLSAAYDQLSPSVPHFYMKYRLIGGGDTFSSTTFSLFKQLYASTISTLSTP